MQTRSRAMSRKSHIAQIIVLVCCVVFANAGEFSSKSRFSVGVYATPGSMMGGGVEFGAGLYQGDILQLRNIIAIESKAAKLLGDEQFDTNLTGVQEKLLIGVFGGASIASYIGFSYFRPYLYVGGGFSWLSAATSSFAHAPYYWEMSAGLGHEFISRSGHSAFFELGGGVGKLTATLANQSPNAPLGGMFKVSIGYRYQF